MVVEARGEAQDLGLDVTDLDVGGVLLASGCRWFVPSPYGTTNEDGIRWPLPENRLCFANVSHMSPMLRV